MYHCQLKSSKIEATVGWK